MKKQYENSITVKSVNDIYIGATTTECCKIKINPTYQRGIVWDKKQKQAFIDSLFRGIAPTNLIFNINAKGEIECIDGKQRISAIVGFRNDEFPLKLFEEDKEELVYFRNIPYGKHKEHLRTFSDEERNIFNNVNIPIVTYKNLKYEERVDIFCRIQKGKKLTPGETVSACFATDGLCNVFNKWCSDMECYFKYVKKVNTERMDHKKIIANLLYIVQFNKFGSEKGVIDNLRKYKWSELEKLVKNMELVKNVLHMYNTMANNSKMIGEVIIFDLYYSVLLFIHNNPIYYKNHTDIIIDSICVINKKYYNTQQKIPKKQELYNELEKLFTNMLSIKNSNETNL